MILTENRKNYNKYKIIMIIKKVIKKLIEEKKVKKLQFFFFIADDENYFIFLGKKPYKTLIFLSLCKFDAF